MQIKHDSSVPEAIVGIAQTCLAHLDEEEGVLAATQDMLARLRVAVLAGEPRKLAEALHAQEPTARALIGIRQQRQQLCQEAAALMKVPADTISLSKLAGCCPPGLAKRLLDKRAPLRARAAEVDRLTRDIALLSHSFLDFLQRFFVEITGNGNCSGRYGPAGVRREPACGALLQAQG